MSVDQDDSANSTSVVEEVAEEELHELELIEELRATGWVPEADPYSGLPLFAQETAPVVTMGAVLPSEFTAYALRMPKSDGEGYGPFTFEGRRHMCDIYDTPARRILLTCGRQVEKCQNVTSALYAPNGRRIEAKDIRVGQDVICLDMVHRAGTRFTQGKVAWVSLVSSKPGVRVTTRQGHVLEVATTHPLRVWDGWREASAITAGTRVAAVRKAGTFNTLAIDPNRIELTAFMLGDGGMTQPTYSFTGAHGAAMQRCQYLLHAIGHTFRETDRDGTPQLFIHKNGPLYTWMSEDGLDGKYSYEKEIPAWVFDLNREDTALFLNRLWSTDGHVKQRSRSAYDVSYCSTSRVMARQVQALLWKFGVPTASRENQPSYVCKNGDPARLAYIPRVETASAVRIFLEQIGALGKSEGVTPPVARESNNRDTYPIEINALLHQIFATNPRARGLRDGKSLRAAGLRATLKYPPSRRKLQAYVDFFRRDTSYAPALVEQLSWHLDTDVYWDEVETVEPLSALPCVDFEVEKHHNFLVDGVVTHNSTALGNLALAYSCMVSGYKTLYVSPSATQTKTFSVDRLKEPLETSDILKGFSTTFLQQNVFEKQFVNRSKITLRYAFLNADRIRGIAAYRILIDELQDILSDSIPVIEQANSHAPERWKSFVYAGTPKGLDNTLEFYRSGTSKDGRPMSTMGEWVVPCDRHGGEGGRYWNVLGERNIQKKGLSCEKCHQLIDPMHADAQWARMQDNGIFENYRIPQLMVPWRSWEEIMLDYGRYDRAKFYNEVLGTSYDSGLRPLTKQQMRDVCVGTSMEPRELEKYRTLSASQPVFAGVDWGTGESAYTVLTLATYISGKFTVFYAHRFTGEDVDPEPQLEKISQMIQYFNVRLIGADYGGGFHPNDRLTRLFGPKRVWKYMWMPRGRKKLEWKGNFRRFHAVRTEVLSDIFNAIKRKQIMFPAWTDFEDPYAQDFLNVFAKYNNQLRMIQYDHRPDRPDDTLHSTTYCFLVSMLLHPRPDIIAPNRELPGVGPVRSGNTGPTNQF